MTETTPAQTPSLAERTIARLRKIATGNGLEPAAISLIETQESVFTLNGRMEVSPLCETQPTAYGGGVRGKDRKTVESLGALQQTVAKHKQEFAESPDWLTAVTAEIQAHPGQGWGLENAKVTLPAASAVYAATETCPSCDGRQLLTCTQCQGQGTVICTQCQGQGREQCYYCGGNGENPQQPGQRCTTCNGTKFAPCRFCQTRGHLPCPTCQGRRGTPCPACQGSGRMTQEIAVTCGAETHFKFINDGLPSGLLRGLDRAGIPNIGKHADIVATPPQKVEGEEMPSKAPFPILIYKVALPYAEMRIGLGGKKAVVSAFGKRCVIMGVPPFLDPYLQPLYNKLHDAAMGKGPLDDALQGRAMRDMLALTVSGKGRIEEVRKEYPFGISNELINATLADTQLALNAVTLKTRAVIAALCAGLCAVTFYSLFNSDTHAQLMMGKSRAAIIGMDSAFLGVALAVSWAVMNFSTRFVLQKRFPQLAVALQQKIGKTGYSMLGGIIAGFVLSLLFSPMKAIWLGSLLR